MQTLPEAAGGAGGFTYSLSPALPEGLSFDPASRALTGAPAEVGVYSMTYTATDSDGAQVSLSFKIEIRKAMAAQIARSEIRTSQSRSVAENSPAGTRVGEPVTGTPNGDETFTYTLTGEAADSGAFVIDSASGQISVAAGATLDFETKSSYTGKVEYTVQGQAAEISLTIDVTDLEAGQPGAPTVTRTEFNQPSEPALDVSWMAPADIGVTITGYEAQYRKQGAAEWTAYGGSLSAATTSFNLPDLEAGATYEARVRAVAALEGPGAWSATGSGRANRPPRRTSPNAPIPFLTLQWGGDDAVRAISAKFADDDGDTLTYSASALNPGILGVSIEGSSPTNLRIKLLNPGTSTVTYGVHDRYGGYISESISASSDALLILTRSVAENSAAAAVGAPVTGRPYNGETLTYSLTGEAADSGAFVIDSATGQISVAENASLDFETKSSYTGQVRWTVQGEEAEISVTIELTDLEVGQPDAPTLTRTRFNEPSNPALDVIWTAPDANGTTLTGYEVQYRKQDAAEWTAYGGELSAETLSLNLPDLEAGATYEVQVRALTATEGEGPWSATGSARANRAPDRHIAKDQYVDSGPGKYGWVFRWVSPLNGGQYSDPDGDTLTFAYASDNNAVARGAIKTEEEGKQRFFSEIRHPVTDWVAITLTASDGYGGTASHKIYLKGDRSVTYSVSEKAAVGTEIGRLFSRQAKYPHPDPESLSLSEFPDGLFTFAENDLTGGIKLAQGDVLDYETTTSLTGKVEYTAGGAAAVIDVTIQVTDAEAGKPDAPTLTRTEFAEENASALDVTWTAPDANGTTLTGYEAQYRKQGAAEWTAYGGSLSAATTGFNLPNLEAGATYEARVRALTSLEGPGPWSDTGSGQANQPPTKKPLYLPDDDIPWRAGYVRTEFPLSIHFEDADGDTLRYTASSEYPGLIKAWVDSDDHLRVWARNPGRSTITYGARDGYGGYVPRTFVITGKGNVNLSVAENSPAGTAVGDPVNGKPYQEETYTHSLTGEAADSGAFVIDSASGQISVAAGATLDHETKSSYTGQVHWTVQGQAAVANVTIQVTDVEAGQPDALTLTRTEFDEPTDPALDVTWMAPPDTGVTITGYEAQYRTQGAAEWTAYGGSLSAGTTSLNLPDLEAGATYEARVRALTSLEGPGPWSATGSGRANRPPNTTNGFLIDSTSWMSSDITIETQNPLSSYFGDADGDTLRYSATSEYPGVVRVGISESKLIISHLNPGSSTLTYGAHDPYGGYVFRTVEVSALRNVTRSIAENSPAGTAVGEPVQGALYNGETLTHTLTGEAADSGAFVIDEASGQIRVAQGATLDHETKSSYTGEVHWTVQGQAAVANVTIQVTDVEAGQPDAPTLTRTEFDEPTDPALDVSWTAPPDTGATITGYETQYRKQGAAEWTAYSGSLPAETTSLNLPDLEAGATYEAQVRALTNLEGPGPWSATGTGQANRPPNTTNLFLSDHTYGLKLTANDIGGGKVLPRRRRRHAALLLLFGVSPRGPGRHKRRILAHNQSHQSELVDNHLRGA